MTEPLVIPARFNGPPGSGNGGYCCGRFAALLERPRTATITLRAPPPLDTPLAVTRNEAGVQVHHEGTLVADVRPGSLELEPPPAPSLTEAEDSAKGYIGFHDHPYRTCFVCGPDRAEGDGLRIFPGRVAGRDLVAAPWTPDENLADASGRVTSEHLYAALDCPSYFALPRAGELMSLLGRLTARVDDRPRAGERCVVSAWAIREDGRKHFSASALYGEDGRLLALAEALWVELKEAA